ncbi:hypothetical protein [Stenotrophomonas sepilia]|uniref:hypothetical protein n=1 Tax=Stenotrophomonas sepilia TaxID=2860290 RepID=UPI0033426EF8
MELQVIDIDTPQPNGKRGDPARISFTKVNENFAAVDENLATIYAGQYRKNRLINGDFRVWNRGTTFSSAGYCADRWYFSIGNVPGSKIERNMLGPSDVAEISSEYKCLPNITVGTDTSAAGHFCALEQRIEGVHTLAGKRVTISMMAYCLPAQAGRAIAIELQQFFGSGGSPSPAVTAIGSKKFVLAAGFNRIEHTVDIPATTGKVLGSLENDFLALTIWLSAGTDWNARSANLGPQPGNTYLAAIQVEEGEFASSFDNRPVAEEMALCMRYCYAFEIGSGHGHTPCIGLGGNQVLAFFKAPLPMRATPGARSVGAAPTVTGAGMSSGATVISQSYTPVSPDTVALVATVPQTTAASTAGYLGAQAGGFKLLLEAEL